MRSTLLSIVLAAVSITQIIATPETTNTATSGSAQTIDDATVLNFALTLEHLEKEFYAGALAKFDQNAFLAAGLPPWARGRFSQIADHEKTHVDFLSKALGDKAVQACTYNFPYNDPRSFAALSQILEGVGVSAYTGAAHLINNKDYLTAAASILATESRHAAFVSSAVNRMSAWNGAFDIPLSLNEVYTLAANFIVSCPSTNAALPVKAFPALSIQLTAPGETAAVSAPSAVSPPTYIVFFSGLDKIFVKIMDGKVSIPKDLAETVYAVATTSDSAATDDTIVAGPAILMYPKDSNNSLMAKKA
ncbi:Protein rds1 [Psilocybe cubensis]|uniref:Protein rds1 n=2 Tax=Psilocybe cubensis TaxID=181762 RepID=A0ACB8HAU6_PSICU|nr:Protein rds1 [Psilocybe cubensis]KAH9484918.1 Protein rds1 [Psilocybe cubensis]